MNKSISNPAKFPGLLAIILALVLIAGFFLPYMTMKEEYRLDPEISALLPLEEELGISAKDFQDMSLFKYITWVFRIQYDDGTRAIYAAILGGIAIVLLIFALARRATPIVLLSVVFIYLHNMFSSIAFNAGTDSAPFDWSIGHSLLTVCPWILAVVGLILLIAKIIYKRRLSR